MIHEIRSILAKSRATVIEDSLGVVALFSLLVLGLTLSGAA